MFASVTAARPFTSAFEAPKKRAVSKLLPTEGKDPSVSSAAPPSLSLPLPYLPYLNKRHRTGLCLVVAYIASSDATFCRSKPQIRFRFGRCGIGIIAVQPFMRTYLSTVTRRRVGDPGFASQRSNALKNFIIQQIHKYIIRRYN